MTINYDNKLTNKIFFETLAIITEFYCKNNVNPNVKP